MAKIRFALAFVLLVASSTLIRVGCHDEEDESSTKNVKKLVELLESFVLENKTESGLSSEDLRSAFEECENWDPKLAVAKFRKDNLIDCISYMLVPVVTLDSGEDVQKLESTYNSMREACKLGYVGKFYAGTSTLDALTRSLMLEILSHQEPLTRSLLEDGHEEYKSYLRQFLTTNFSTALVDIVQADWLLQYLSNVSTRTLARKIYPLMSTITNDTDAQSMKSIFTEEMRRNGRVVVNDEIKVLF